MSLVRLLMLVCLCGWGAAVAQSDEPNATQLQERDRLSDEMKNLAKRQIWAGVERKYQQLVDLGLDLRGPDHLSGAYAARELGRLGDVHERLTKAAAIEPTKEIIDWLWDIDHNYGHVVLIADKKGTAVLEAPNMPLDPNQRKAVEQAIKESKDNGRFEGLLPRGSYVFGGQEFAVEPGVGLRVEVSPKMRRQGLIDPVIIYPDNPTATGQSSE